MKNFWIAATMMPFLVIGAAPAQKAETFRGDPVFETPAALTPQNRIDELVFAHWKQVGAEPSRLCSDAVFVRQAYLDTIGTLPTAAEAQKFLADAGPHKRTLLIDDLLERDLFADYWAMRWIDTLRIKAEFPIELWPDAAQSYHHWIRESIAEKKPYDVFARELLTASGSDFRVAPANFYRAMQDKDPKTIARTVALTFMGTKAETWPPDKLDQMAVFFSHVGYKETREWKEEIVFFDPTGETGGVKRTAAQLAAESLPRAAILPDDRRVRLDADEDPRQVFADWLTTPENPWFSRAIVNRVWFWLMGRGLTDDPEETGPGVVPENAALLTYLQQELVRSHFDLKHVYRLILTSETYRLSSLPQGNAVKSRAHFASYAPRRLDAEVLIDALCQVTGTSDDYSSSIPEPFTFMPEGQRAISLPDGSITSAFLEQFGKPSRDTGFQSERNNSPTDAQRLHMLNSSHIQNKIQQGPVLRDLARNAKSGDDLLDSLYLTILSRFPSTEERVIAKQRLQSGQRWEAVTDLAWAMLNSTEFLYRH